MNTILAYVIVVTLSSFMLTIGTFASALLAMVLFWVPATIRAPFCALLGGATGSFLAVSLSYGIFYWLKGPDSFGLGPFLAATIPLSIPIYNDYKKSRELNDLHNTMPPRVAAFTTPELLSWKTLTVGYFTGIVVAAIFFL